jgi:uncharacterized MAPEG superfamily protein
MQLDAPTIVAVVAGLWAYLNWFLALTYLRLFQWNVLAEWEDDPESLGRGLPQSSTAETYAVVPPPRKHRYNNSDPTKGMAELYGAAKRALAAMNNQAEQFPHFIAPLLMCLIMRGPQNGSWVVAAFAVAHVVSRTLHVLLYVYDFDLLRSLVFTIGFLLNLVLWGLAFAPAV